MKERLEITNSVSDVNVFQNCNGEVKNMAIKFFVKHDQYFGPVISIALKVSSTTFKLAPDIYIIQNSKSNFFRS